MNSPSGDMKRIGTAVGLVMLIVGIVMAIIGISSFASAFGSTGPGSNAVGTMLMMAAGFFLITIGLIVLYLSNIGRMASYVARETAPAAQTTFTAVGRGIQSAGGLINVGQNPLAPPEVVKVRCRYCGYLDTEDAEFCSKCGNKL